MRRFLKQEYLCYAVLLLIFTVGVNKAWCATINATVKMTYVDYNNPTTPNGEIGYGSTAKAGYNKISNNAVGFGNIGWGCNWITYIQVDASAISGGVITGATLSAEVSGSTDNLRATNWGVGYNSSTWLSWMTYDTADKSITTCGSTVWTSTKSASTFEYKTFDITDALRNDDDGIVTIIVYEMAAAGGYIKNPSVTITYDPIGWSSTNVTVDILDVGSSNPNMVSALPTLRHVNSISYYGSSNTSVATFYNNELHVRGIGTTTITATDYQNNSASYTLTVTGTYVTPTVTSTSLSFASEGILINCADNQAGHYVLSGKGLTIDYGFSNETAIAVNSGMGTVLKIIDANGYSHPNVDPSSGPSQSQYGGTYIKLTTSASGGNLVVTGNVDSERSKLYLSNGTLISTTINGNTLKATLSANNTYFLYNERTSADQSNNVYVPMVNTINFSDAYFDNATEVITVPTNGQYTVQTAFGMANPIYTIECKGDVGNPTISGTTISGIEGGGAIKVTATDGGSTLSYIITVAYPATPYPGKLWDFNIDDGEKASLEVHADYWSEGKGFPRIDARQTPAITYEGREYEDATGWSVTDNHGGTWIARNKNANTNSGRDARWRYTNAVHGDNAFIINETAGLIFNTGADGFFIRNDRLEKDAPPETPDAYKGQSCWSHVGIRQYGSSFTIPRLKAGDIIEINWKRESGGAGSIFEATNASDLRDIEVTKRFVMTGSQIGTTGGVTDFHKNPGLTSFKATADGDVTFTLRDNGATDILSIRIYSGDYKPTMKTITSRDGHNPDPEMLVDNSYKEYAYNYCNMLNSTNTGPAFYVLKGWRNGTDNVESITGTDASRNIVDGSPQYTLHTDLHAYEVADANEEARLYDLRKNLIGFRLWNYNWVSSRNAYNDGRVGAQGGWGKVTFRMNNYTNFVDESDVTMGVYLIGYTPDCTLTIGSAPHQTYPYTWDFTKIAGGTATGKNDNVLYSIEEEGSLVAYKDQDPTNWIKKDNGQFVLNIDNSEEASSQYVPGAVLVTTERALSKYSVPEGVTPVYAKDELDGLGFAGEITMHIDHLPTGTTSGWKRKSVADIRNSILSFNISDYAVFNQTGGTVDEPIGTWSFPTDEQDAGDGKIQLNEHCSIHESPIPEGGIGYQLDGGETKYICIKLASNLQPGDIISITAYNIYNQDTGISFYSNRKDQGGSLLRTIDFNRKSVEETVNYTVVDNQGLDGKNTFYLYRKDDATIHITAIEITRSASAIPALDWSIYTLTRTTITVPDLNADSKQDWIYVCATRNPRRVVNYDTTGANEIDLSRVTDAAGGGPDANTNVYKYKVSQPGNVNLIFDEDTKIYKIGVTHILKEIHPVGGTGWATEIRNQNIDHELIGYFTKNDVNAYTVKYDSYDMKTATVALTPINEDGYVKAKTGIVMKLDNVADLSDANDGKNVPLFYPSYTRPETTTSVNFPANNMMYQDENGIDRDNRNYNETYDVESINYTKFILTNKYWTFDKDHTLSTDEAATQHTAETAGFYRMHIWKTGDVETKNTMPAHTAYLLVPSDNLPAAVWTLQSGYSAARETTLGVYNIIGPNSATGIEDIELTPGLATDEENTAEDGVWYTLSGVKLPKRPNKEGLYIWRSVEGGNNGKTVFVNPRGR